MDVITTLNEHIESFKSFLKEAEQNLINAAKIYVQAVDEHGDAAREAFQQAIPEAPKTFWRRIEGVGRGNIDNRLVLERHVGATFLERLPKHMQTDIMNQGVKVLVEDGDHLMIRIENMTREQCRMVFAYDRIRDLSEQRAWLESNNLHTHNNKLDAPYKISGSTVIINKPMKLNKSDLLSLLAQMK